MATSTVNVGTLMYLIDVRLNSSVNQVLKTLDDRLDSLEKSMNKTKQATNGMNMALMSFGLSALFTGMAVKNFSQQVLTSLVTAFVTARDEGDFFVNKLLAMQASFEFLKFAMFDAFAQSDLFVPLIDGIISLVNGISELVTKNPEIAKLTIAFLIAGVVIGGVAMVVGQLALAAIGLGIGLLPLIGIVVILSIGFAILFSLITSEAPPIVKLLGSVATIMLTIVGVMALFGVVAGLPFIIIGTAIGVVVGGFIMLADKLGGVKEAFKGLGIFILRIFAWIGEGLTMAIIAPLNHIITLINAAILGSNRFLGTSFNTIDTVKAFDFGGSKIDQWRDEMIAEGQAKKASSSSTSNNITNVYNFDKYIGDKQEITRMIEETQRDMANQTMGAPIRG